MNMKTVMIALAALAMSGTTHAITSEEIANALGVDPNIATFSLGGVSEWSIDTNTVHSGGSALKSGAVKPSSSGTWVSSVMTMSVSVTESCKMSFWHKVSCSTSSYNGYVRFYITIDGTKYEYYGEKDWTKMTQVFVPGQHTVKFAYSKTYNYVAGSDCAWIDDISVEPIMPTASKVEVANIKCQQRYPWNGMVDVDYTVTSDDPNADVWVYPIGYDKDSNTSMAPRALTGDGVNAPVKAGTHRMTWTVTEDYPDFHSTAFTVKMVALVGAAPYMVVDLSGGVDAISYPVSYLSSVPEGGWGNEYKTTKLVLRLIPPGSFMMGSPSDESGRSDYEDLHGVVLTKPFYIGVFEVTQKQYQLVMGATPASYKGDCRPVEQVSYRDIRGSVNGVAWPTHNQVDANSFMGRLRSKANMLFDLPTEAQWEYACRSGTTTGLNSGLNYSEFNLKQVARCSFNTNDGKGGFSQHTVVGCYRDNAWGLYDMHGNIREWCRDFIDYKGLGGFGAIDPKGAGSGYKYSSNYDGSRATRGGSYNQNAQCRSAYRYMQDYYGSTQKSSYVGFRVFCSPVAE